MPEVLPTVPFSEMLTRVSTADTVLFCYEGENTEPIGAFLAHALPCVGSEIAVVVGSEGGFSLSEVEQAVGAGDAVGVEEEIGDLLLTAASLARKLGVDPEQALTKATDKFIARFALVETAAAEMGADLSAMTVDARENLWKQAKKR